MSQRAQPNSNSSLAGLRSLGLRSDLCLLDAEILERGDYLVVRSPNEPGYYWGNLLVFPGPPQMGDHALWEELFTREFSGFPQVRHKTFAWDLGATAAVTKDFTEAGYHHERTSVLTTNHTTPPPHLNTEIKIRTLESDVEWQDTLELQVATRDPEHAEADYRDFASKRQTAHRRKVRQGDGVWYGAYLDNKQVASLGIFWALGSARFQVVVTLAECRRQGICGSLVHHVAEAVLARPTVDSLVMLADSDYHAGRIYESVGFTQAESIEGLCLWP